MENIEHKICSDIVNDIINKIIKINNVVSKIKNIDIDKLSKLLYEISYMPNDNMSRFINSELLENVFATLIDGIYVGNIPEWETDIVYPFVENVKDNHLKLEVKSLKDMFNKNGDTKSIIIKNGRGEGQTIRSLLTSIKKNIFILIEKKQPFSISYVYPQDLLLFIGSKKDAKKIIDIEKDYKLLNKTAAELSAYVKKDNIHFIHSNILKDNHNYKVYNPKDEMIKAYINRFSNNFSSPTLS